MQNVKQKILWLWQNAEKLLIVLFFATFTFNIRKAYLTPFSYLNGGFNEYGTIFVSWTDVLIVVTIIIYIIKLAYSQLYDSSQNAKVVDIRNLSNLYNVSRETLWILIFLLWCVLSIIWSYYKPIAIYRSISLIEIAIFTWIVIKIFKNTYWLKISFFALIINGVFQAFLGIVQFFKNSSIGLQLLGESIVGPNIDGVAKIIIVGEKHIRAYGTFPHPNIMAGFLLVPLILIALGIFQNVITQKSKDLRTLTSNDEIKQERKKVTHETYLKLIPAWLLYASGSIIAIGFGLTFSRSAFLGLIVGLLICFVCFTYNKTFFIKMNLKSVYMAVLVIILLIAIILLLKSTSFFSNKSLEERNLYQNVSYETIVRYPIKGVGIGQFVVNEYRQGNLESWQYQPVHNVYLLIFSELGIIGIVSFLLFLILFASRINLSNSWKDSWNYNMLTKLAIYCIIISFFVISFFDHYFWDIRIGMFIFAMPVIFTHAV